MKNAFLFIVMLLPFTGICQDTIVTRNAKEIKAKVLEIDDVDIRYKLFNNLDGPVMVIRKKQVTSISYQNGTQMVFGKARPKKQPEAAGKMNQSKEIQVEDSDLLRRNNRVFVIAPDKGYKAHGEDALRSWGRWQVVEEQKDADIIANFKVHRRMQTVKGIVLIINAKTGKVIYKSKKVDTFWSAEGWNHKLLAIQKLVDNRIVPFVETGKE